MFSAYESKQALRMILSCITSCEGHELRKLLTMLSIYLLPAHKDHNALRK